MRMGLYKPQGLIVGREKCRVLEGAHYTPFTSRLRTLLCMVWFDGMGLCMVQASGWRGARSDGRTGKPRRSEWEGIQPSALRLLLECIELRQGIAQGVVQEVTHRPRCCVPTVFEKKLQRELGNSERIVQNVRARDALRDMAKPHQDCHCFPFPKRMT